MLVLYSAPLRLFEHSTEKFSLIRVRTLRTFVSAVSVGAVVALWTLVALLSAGMVHVRSVRARHGRVAALRTVVANRADVACGVGGHWRVTALNTVVAGVALASDVVLSTLLAVVAGVTWYAVRLGLFSYNR